MVVNVEDLVDAKHHAKHHAKHAEAADANNLVDVANEDHLQDHLQAANPAKNQAVDAVVAHASKFF